MRSIIFFTILFSMIGGNLLWWRHAHRRVGKLRRAAVWRWAVGLWAGGMAFVVVLIVLSRGISSEMIEWTPQAVVAATYIWHVLFIFPWLIWRAVFNSARQTTRLIRKAPADAAESGIPMTSRRQFLTVAAIVTPPTLATLAAWRAVQQFDQFRINSVSLAIPNLPPALEGLRIAHVSDIHIGKFTDDPLLKAVVERTNLLKPDLVLFTGDLIDYSLADLPAGLGILRRWDPRFGLCVCEGNHDLMAGREPFERQVTNAGFPLPINRSHQVTIRGQEIQLLGLRWGGPNLGKDSMGSSDDEIAGSVQSLLPQLRSGAFPILLAHHPHAFDYLGDAPIPLVLAGHTHGGQINFGPIHPASLRFRYLSGLYRQTTGRQMFVSNGVGNWFPLRINAPAEIVDITLRSA